MKINNIIILDASGSMSCIYKQALDGVNNTITTIRDDQAGDSENQQLFSLCSFHSGPDYLTTIYNETPIEQVRNITRNDYVPGGCTALFDAIGETLTKLEQRLHQEKDMKSLVTIITDGMENASRQFTAEMVRDLITRLSEKEVVFTYIGANQDVLLEARRMGIENAMSYSSDAEGTREMWEKERRARSMYYANTKACGTSRASRASFFGNEDERYKRGAQQPRFTPTHIDRLAPGEVFVFGSHVSGTHAGGAARHALLHFGAVMGQGEGLQGQSYAIPTTGCNYQSLIEAIGRFLDFAEAHPDLHFYVTAIGCGNAGYHPRDLAPHFARARKMQNVSLPREFMV